MAHITFIHGIHNKPAPQVLLRIWRDGLRQDEGLDLGAEGITSTMVYWADVLYSAPDEEMAAFESAEPTGRREDPEIDLSWRETLPSEERDWTDALAARLNFDASPPDGEDDEFEAPSVEPGIEFERIPLPWWLKRRIMKAYLRDVHHYLFNTEHSPRPGVSFRVQDEIRSRLIRALEAGRQRPGPHVLVSHSMGTVVAYDCLKRVPECPAIDGLMTIGSPLGLDEIQDKLRPEWSRDDGFPLERLDRRWINVFDRLDPVAGFDPKLTNDYRHGGRTVVEDIHEPNHGRWRHSIGKYLAGRHLRAALAQLAGLE